MTSKFEPHVLYAEHFAFVWRLVHRLGIQLRDRPDAVQEIFARVFIQLKNFDRSRPIRPWIFGIAFRYVSEYSRRSFVRNEVLQDEQETDDYDLGPEAELDARRLVDRGLQFLSLEQRTVLVLIDLEGFEPQEVAKSLNLSVNTVYSRLRLARAKFKEFVQEVRREESSHG